VSSALDHPSQERILELKPYAITLDIMMPSRDGGQCTDLKSDPDTGTLS
jgi:CheY-like chemotaxis protein